MAGKQTTGRRIILGLVGVLGSLTIGATASYAAVYVNGTDLSQASVRAQAYIACNGGPAVTVETYRSNGTVIDRFSGSLITSPDGQNRTVLTCAHGWFDALNVDSNAYARVLTGTNYLTDRGQEIVPTEVLLAPNASDWRAGGLDLVAIRLPYAVPNTGQFVVGPVRGSHETLTTIGVGYRLTQEQLANGTYAPRDGNFGRFDGEAVYYSPSASASDNLYSGSNFYPARGGFNGVGAGGDSGSGTFLESSFQFDASNRIMYGEYLGTTVGYGGDRLSAYLSTTAYTDANYPVSYQFINSAITPEPGSAMLLLAAAGLLMRRTRRR